MLDILLYLIIAGFTTIILVAATLCVLWLVAYIQEEFF